MARLSPPPPPPSRHKPSSFRAGQCHRGERDRRRVYFFHFLEDGPTRPRRVFADVLSPYLLTFMSVVLRLATTVLASLARLGLCSGDMESLFSALALPKPNPVCRSHRAAAAASSFLPSRRSSPTINQPLRFRSAFRLKTPSDLNF